ncbi:lipopolysaccharide biosynthesis protein [Fulvivirga sediminis]|uniref:Lipopolysaccharide biosynthesis protein n=1 Tax=Fulvivirga sediminis TaxID=2803949 RepID=A0A937JZK9_9BACT|nr:lipopolysaccharide biosynthesis protein [Fulvivirga sediminis]MBL3655390.1 lipopolysaccharide biosynthesis protein [Fulvivirga sediminis]
MTSLKKRSTSAFFWDLFGTVFQQGAVFFITVFLTRLLTPEDFGLIGMAMVFVSVAQVFIEAGLGAALIQDDNSTNLTYTSVFYMNIIIGILLTVLTYFCSDWFGYFFESEEVARLIKWLSLIFIFNSFDIVQISILRKELKFKSLTIRLAVSTVIAGLVGVFFAFKEYGVYSLVIQNIVRAVIGSVLLWYASSWRPSWDFSYAEIKRISSFSSFMLLEQIMFSISERLDVLLIGKIFNASTLGFYTRAQTLKDQVTKLSSTSISKVFFPVLTSIKNDIARFRLIYFNLLSVALMVSCYIIIVLYVLAEDLILILFGAEWLPSTLMFKILILSAAAFPVNAIIINAFLSTGKAKENFKIGVFRKLAKLIPLIVALIYGIKAFLICYVVVTYTLTVINFFFVRSYLSISLYQHFKVTIPSLIFLVLFIVIFDYADLSSLWSRLAYLMSCLVIYSTWLIGTENSGWLFLRTIVIEKILKRNG